MLKSILGTHDNGSQVSPSSRRKSKRRDGDEDENSNVSSRRRADSTGTSSTKRRTSRRDSAEHSNGSFHPTSTSFSSSSRSPYADVAAPSVASSYATAYTDPSNAPIQRPEVVRNESMAEKVSRKEKSKRDGQRSAQSDLSRGIDDDNDRGNAGRGSDRRRDSARKSSRKDTATRAADDHDSSLPSHQFPDQEPSGFGVASPYRPPGLASGYYGDHGESVAEQPGVRPNQPSVIISADQAHLWEPTVEAKPPPEPSSLGQIGAAASFFGEEFDNTQPTNAVSSRPGGSVSQRPGRRSSLKPGKDSTAGGASPRSSPGPPQGRRPLPQSNASQSIGMMGAVTAPLAAGVGAAAEYYTGNISITPHDKPLPSGIPGRTDIVPGSDRPLPSTVSGSQSQSYHTTTENMQTTTTTTTAPSSRPGRPSQNPSSNMPLYGAAAAAAGLAGAAYLAHEHTSAQHEQFVQSPTEYQPSSNIPPRPSQYQSQASFSGITQQQQIRHRHRGTFARFIDWFQDPAAVAEYEAYTEAIGVCKYCFDPNSSPMDAPRRHYYRRRRPSSGSRHGSSTRVDKLTRYSSDENLRRRKSKKGYSTTEKVIATGLAGVGVAAVADEIYKNKNDFDGTYSVKSGQPANRSRVSFHEVEEDRYSSGKRLSRRVSDTPSKRDSNRRRQSGSEGEVRYEKGRRRRNSSASDDRTTSRGGNLSTSVALAGAAAVGAALTSSGSRRSRSRSKSPRKNRNGYYSKRISPQHSYVDLNHTSQDSRFGAPGLGGFFTSPSSNSKKGKKKKGLFKFNNASSSSSDADLAFGEGTVKRKDSRRGRQDERRNNDKLGDATAILGLAATGAALAAETNRRDDKGKRKEERRTESNRYEDDRNRRSRRDDGRESTDKIKLQGYVDSADNGDEGVWEDASDDDKDSIISGLAYGGRLSSQQSKESLNEGTNILGWRFGGRSQKEKEKEKRLRRQSSRPDLTYDPLKAGLVAETVGAAGAAVANYYPQPESAAVESPPKNMPPMQFVDPVPFDSHEHTPRKGSVLTNVSPLSYPPPVTRTSEADLEHPQPVVPFSTDVYHSRHSYTEGRDGPVVYDKSPHSHDESQIAGVVAAGSLASAAVAINKVEREKKRENRQSATMPTVVPALKESVSFDLTHDQEERERKRERKRREKEAARATRRPDTAAGQPRASIITGAERSPERKLETWRLRDAIKAAPPGEPPIRGEPTGTSSKGLAEETVQPLPTPERETRLSEIDRQLEELYAQHREQEAKKNKQIEAAGFAAATVAVGASAIAATPTSSDKDDKKPRRKSSLRKSSKYRDQDAEIESAVSARSAPPTSASNAVTETAAERLARKAARRIQNQRAPSPVHEHDTYGDFFVPEEIKANVKVHNREANARYELDEAKIVNIVPGMKRAETFPDDLYHAYGTEDTDIPPTKLPWRVPMLELVSPTPPPRSPSIAAETSPTILPVSGMKDLGEHEVDDVDPRDVEPRRSSSKVTWGDHEINVYEVITPEYERDGHDFTTTPAAVKQSGPNSPLRQSFAVDDDTRPRDEDMEQQVPPVEMMTKEQQEHLALGREFADMPPSRDTTKDMPKNTEEEPRVDEIQPSSPTPARQFEQIEAGSAVSAASIYQSPFASTVSDLDLPVFAPSSREPADGAGFVAGEVSTTSSEEKSEERTSKSERRRRERAEAAAEPAAGVANTAVAESILSHGITEPHVPGGFDDTASGVNVFDSMVTSNGSTLPSASVLGTAATSVIASDVGKFSSTDRDVPQSVTSDLTKSGSAETFDEEAFVDSFNTPKRVETWTEGGFTTPKVKPAYTSDPEDWEKTSSSAKSKDRSRDDNDFYDAKKSTSSKRKSKRDSQVFNDDLDDDARSVSSTPAEASRSKTKRKSSKRGSLADDDDIRSVTSDTKSAASEPIGSSNRKTKDSSSSTPKKSGWALLGGLIGAAAASKSDVSSKSGVSERRKSKSDSSDKERKSSKSRDREETVVSESRRSRSASQSSAQPVRGESVDDAFVSADENGESTKNENGLEDEKEVGEDSFLVTRPELPTGSTVNESEVGASGPTPESTSIPLPQTAVAKDEVEPGTRTIALDAPAIGSVATTMPSEPSTSEQVDFESPPQPHQQRLSNLRTTDLMSSPTASSPRTLGRFPVSPGIVRTASVGSPPTAIASSPLTASRTRQGRPTSSDFRSGKEFRPLYLVERHSAAKTPTQEEEETYPSLPSSRTSSAHPSLENLRGEYSDGDLETSTQPQPREIGRRYSWSDPRPRSPDFLDSGAATPTQSSFPEELKRDVKEKPKYEFHSPSELLEDPSQHQDVEVAEMDVGSPLPSAVGTERSSSPTTGEPNFSSRLRSSSSRDIGLGIGADITGAAAGAAAGALAVGQSIHSADQNDAPVSREVEVQQPNEKDDFELRPISTKKTKKDKKKKRKTLDEAMDDVQVQDPRDVKVSSDSVFNSVPVMEPEIQPSTTPEDSGNREVGTKNDPFPAAEETVPPLSEDLSLETVDEWALSGKKSKKDKKNKKSKGVDSLPLMSTPEPEPAAKKEFVQAQAEIDPISVQRVTAIGDDTSEVRSPISTSLDITDDTAQLDEKTSQVVFPCEEASNIALPADRDDSLGNRSASPVPSHKSNISAFEAAFEAARAARGLPDGVTVEMAMDKLVAPAADMALKPVNIEDMKDGDKNPFGDDYEVGTSRDASTSSVKAKTVVDDETEVAPEQQMISNAASAKNNLVEVLPSITEVLTPMNSNRDLTGEVEESLEEPKAAVAEEDPWTPPASKKDKKKKKKTRESFVAEEAVPEPKATTLPQSIVENDESKENEEPETPFETPSEQVDDFAWATTKKSKKEKKSKKKGKTVDDEETPTPETGTQTPAGIEPVAGEARDLTLPSTSTETELEPVTTGEQIFKTDQEEPTVDSGKDVETTEPPVVAAGDDFAWTSTKRSSKGKKTKKKSRLLEDLEADAPESGSQTPFVGDDNRILGESHATSEEPQITNESTLRDMPVENHEAMPDKISRDNKDPRSEAKVFDDTEPGFETTDASLQDPSAEDENSEIHASAITAEAPAPLTPVDEQRTMEQPAEEEVAIPAKKSKKDKSSKKLKAVDDFESVSRANESQISDGETNRALPESMLATENLGTTLNADEQKAVEDECAVPTKKSKKDKKSKKAKLYDDPDNDVTDIRTQDAAATKESRESEEFTFAKEPLPEECESTEVFEPTSVASEPLGTPQPTEVELGGTTTKKGKKDKKSKSKTSDYVTEDSMETPTPSSEPGGLEKDEALNLVAISTASLAAGASTGLPGADLPSEVVEKPAEEDDWAAMSSKKSKKEKKSKKKGKLVSLIEDDQSTSVTSTPEPEQEALELAIAEEQADTTQEPATVDEVERHATFVDKLSTEPSPETQEDCNVDGDASAENGEWAVLSKKSKKDKKSKRKESLAAVEEQATGDDAQPQTIFESGSIDQHIGTVNEQGLFPEPSASHVDDITDHYFGMLRNYRPAAGASDNKAVQTSREVQDISLNIPEVSQAHQEEIGPSSIIVQPSQLVDERTKAVSSRMQEHDFPVIPETAHPDEVVGFHHGMLRDYKPPTVGMQGLKEMTEPVVPAASDASATLVPADPEEDERAVPVKKSKKDKKKKRQSAFDVVDEQSKNASENDVMIPVAAGLGTAAVGAGALLASQEETAEPSDVTGAFVAEAETTTFSSKKSKKDKKKRQFTSDAFDDEHSTSPLQETSKETADEELVPSVQGVEAGPPLEYRDEAVESSMQPEESPFEFSTKKSKKDKKKKRKSTFDDLSTAPTPSVDDVALSVPAVEVSRTSESQRDLNETFANTDDETGFLPPKVDDRDNFKQQTDDAVQDEPAGISIQDDLPVNQVTTLPEAKEPKLPTGKPKDPMLGDNGWHVQLEVDAAAPVEEEWALPSKKSKKDKKRKKALLSGGDQEDSTSQPTESLTPLEPAEARDLQLQDTMLIGEDITIKPEIAPAIAPETPVVVEAGNHDAAHETRRDRRLSQSIPGGWGDEEEKIEQDPIVDDHTNSFEGAEKLVDVPEQVTDDPNVSVAKQDKKEVVPAPEDDMGYVFKMGKKGKKSRKSEAVTEETERQQPEEAQVVEAPEVLTEPTEQAIKQAADEEWSFASKKSKKDKKNKKGKNVVEEVSAEQARAVEILTIPETSQDTSSRDAVGEDGEQVPTKKNKKDKKSKRQSTRNRVEDDQPAESLDFPVSDPVHVDDVAGHYHSMLRDYEPTLEAPDNKATLSSREVVDEASVADVEDVTGHYFGMLRDYQPTVGAPDNKATLSSREVVNRASIADIEDVTGHYFGMLRDYQPAVGAPDNKPAVSARDLEAPRAERVPSPVSDEDMRRARRARRKASPVYNGEEPEDLPGNRSLTPPAEHDDVMNTALGVAAGLGLTGAAASRASARSDEAEARSLGLEQSVPTTAQAPSWSFAKLGASGNTHQAERDSGIQFADSPTLPQDQFSSQNRDSGYVRSPATRESWAEEAGPDTDVLGASSRPPRPQSPTSSSEDISGKRSKRVSRDVNDAPTRREPSPVQSTSKDRSSKLFNSSPSNRIDHDSETLRVDPSQPHRPQTDLHRSPTVHGHHQSREELRGLSPARGGTREIPEAYHPQIEPQRSHFGHPNQEGLDRSFSPPNTPLHMISEHSQDTSPSLRRRRELSDIGSEDHTRRPIQHQESGHDLRQTAGLIGAAGLGAVAANELSREDRPASRAKSLGKSKANTKSSRSLRRTTNDSDVVPSSSTHDPFTGKGKEAARDMADVYDGHGEYPGSPMSPTRPPSMRKRQSMQQIRDLETRLDQLAAENRTLAEAKILAERHLEDIQLEQHKSGYAGQEAVEAANLQLREKDDAIAQLQQELEGIRQDHARLSDANAGLSDLHENLRSEHEQRYSQLQDQHAETHQNWQESSRELETLRGQRAELSGGMEDVVRHEIDTALAEKNAEIERLRRDLELAKEKINELQQQILSGGGDDILNFRDEDYFENACQSLCQHVQQWVLRFSKFSDTLVCRTTNQIRDEKLVDRFDLAILDGSDVDAYLTDRIKRRDVFMSVVMTMIFEYIFTRYLFGMDRDQRQTLKKLEKNLAEVGPPSAVHQWRAMTLTLLAKRETFRSSRENDTEAVVLQIYDTLAKFLPPPQNLQAQVQESLRNVMSSAVDLSIEMRTQKAEYIMLPPLQPEYDTNGDLTRKVYFNASLMNERSGETTSNDELEAQQAVVRMVLFPLVVKKGNDEGEGEEEIVVCPAQVLVARPDRKSKANSGRVVSGQSDRMSVDQMSRGNISRHSLAPSTMDMSNVI